MHPAHGHRSRSARLHDGELEHTLENRKIIARLIRDWQADLVFGHRPYDYHPDHHNVGLLIRDAAFMVMVPDYVPDTPSIRHRSAFFYFPDRFTRSHPFKADVAVSINDVFDKKVQALDALESQVYDGGALGNGNTPKQRFADAPKRRIPALAQSWKNRYGNIAEAFEICEYGHQPGEADLRRYLPFFPEEKK